MPQQQAQYFPARVTTGTGDGHAQGSVPVGHIREISHVMIMHDHASSFTNRSGHAIREPSPPRPKCPAEP
ncbi:hypothetical protein GCM10011588_68160 [Nocardia jinanensis]|uniref:Uncharacterized protein n=1 Tax=Nocardia jinanensis TaxID=382504 RepID=A0A917VY86_9NOCA|nr:hypothetical protein GCM10011588_68160 [Nocardia jinanensis]